MSERVTMPALGESVTEGTVTRWLKNVGDEVAVDEPLLEVSTDKVDTEIPSPVAGTLQEILAQEDDTVPVGADLAVIGAGTAGESPTPAAGAAAAEAPAAEPAAAQDSTAPEAQAPAAAPAEMAPSTEQPVAPETSEPEAPAASGVAQQEQPVPSQAADPQSQAADPQSQAVDPQSQAADPQSSADDAAPAAVPSSGGTSGGQTVTMPALGESVTEGTVTRWLKAEGDTVEVDEPLLEVSTDKVDTEIPSPVAGTLTKILVAEDDTVPVGGDLAVIGGDAPAGEPTPAPAAQPVPKPEPDATAAPEAQPEPAPQPEPAGQPEPAPSAHAAPAPAPAAEAAPTPAAPSAPAPAATTPGAAPAPAAPTSTPAPAATPTTPGPDGNGGGDSAAYVTPLVRKLAAQHDVDLASLTGTGIGGRIRKQDVLDAAEAAKQPAEAPAAAEEAPAPSAAGRPAGGGAPGAASPKRGTTEKMTRLRKVIAQRMVESLQVSAQLTTVVEVDLTKVARLRERAKREFESREGTKLSYLPFLALAAVEALKAHPAINSSVDGDEITYHGEENLSIAVDTEKGLIVPVVKHAGDLNIAGLARAIAELADRTRNNKIAPDDLAGGTFTITNTGSRGALFDTPIINQPQVAILGTGALVKRPVVVADVDGGETIAVRSMMYLALSYDHRIVDGAEAARFLGTMKARLEEGRFEASLGL